METKNLYVYYSDTITGMLGLSSWSIIESGDGNYSILLLPFSAHKRLTKNMIRSYFERDLYIAATTSKLSDVVDAFEKNNPIFLGSISLSIVSEYIEKELMRSKGIKDKEQFILDHGCIIKDIICFSDFQST